MLHHMLYILAVWQYAFALVNAASLRAWTAPGIAANASQHATRNGLNSSVVDVAVSTLFSFRSARQSPQAPPPELFVAVFTTRATPIEQRDSVRQLWREVDGGPGHICARFIVCEAVDAYQPSLQKESTMNGDVLFLPCQEGYAQGLLTKKVIATMRAYRNAAITKDVCLNRPLFMKVDDDTFVSGHRFREGLEQATKMYGELVYAGVDLPSQPPERNPNSHWYEPYQTWPQGNYPPAMYGGPGYILGRKMVQRIVDEGIADSYVLWNEDRAVGVWVNALQQRGVFVNWIRIPGTNGFHWDKPTKGGSWGQYPYVLAHHLSKSCILCLMNIDHSNDPGYPTDHCFQMEPLAG